LLDDNSLVIGTGNLFAPNREFIKPSREIAVSRRELPAMRGNSAILGPLCGRLEFQEENKSYADAIS
jgi:hypothetical protein